MQKQINGNNTPENIKSYYSFGFHKVLLDNLSTSNFSEPTRLQNHIIPNIMSGSDLWAIAKTGSDKTVAYILPILHKLMSIPESLSLGEGYVKPQVIILTPKEYMKQIYNALDKFTKNTHLKCAVLCGRVSVKRQKFVIDHENGIHILVATPGRLKNLVDRGIIILSSVKILVLNETDIMIKMNTTDQIKQILDHETMNSKDERQTLMFSATREKTVKNLAKLYLKSDKINFSIVVVEGACKYVEQTIKKVCISDKHEALLSLMEKMEASQSTIVFVQEKRLVDSITEWLSENGFPATSIHGDRQKPEREQALIDFKTNKMKILVVTSTACKGLDIKNVQSVVNYDLTKSVDEYIHRIELTGILGNSAKVVSFFDPESDNPMASKLMGILKQVEQEIPQWLREAADDFKNFKKIQRRTENELDSIFK